MVRDPVYPILIITYGILYKAEDQTAIPDDPGHTGIANFIANNPVNPSRAGACAHTIIKTNKHL